MSENNQDPVQPDNTAGQQPTGTQSTDNWEERFKGLQRKFNTLMEAKGDLEGQLAAQHTTNADKDQQLATLSNEKDSLQLSTQQKIEELTSQISEKDKSLSELSQMQLKVKVANELGHPELLQLIDTIPGTDDPEKVESAFKTILGFTKSQIEQREKQLSEGLMPGDAPPDGKTMPSTEQGWTNLIDSLQLGSEERDDAFDKYFKWMSQKDLTK